MVTGDSSSLSLRCPLFSSTWTACIGVGRGEGGGDTAERGGAGRGVVGAVGKHLLRNGEGGWAHPVGRTQRDAEPTQRAAHQAGAGRCAPCPCALRPFLRGDQRICGRLRKEAACSVSVAYHRLASPYRLLQDAPWPVRQEGREAGLPGRGGRPSAQHPLLRASLLHTLR